MDRLAFEGRPGFGLYRQGVSAVSYDDILKQSVAMRDFLSEISGAARLGDRGKINTDFVYPPIPIRAFDYCAYFDGDEPDDDGRMLCGHGRTPEAAMIDLVEQFEWMCGP
jgi:hypothetical protein